MSEIKSSVGRFKYLTGTTSAAKVDAEVYAANQARVAQHIDARAISPEDRAMLRAMLLGGGGVTAVAHSVAWVGSPYAADSEDPWKIPRLTCHANRETDSDARCRRYCGECEYIATCDGDGGCDNCHRDAPVPVTFDHCPYGHPLSWQDCNMVEWVEASGVSDSYAGQATFQDPPQRDALIKFEWTGEGYLWDYAAEVSA